MLFTKRQASLSRVFAGAVTALLLAPTALSAPAANAPVPSVSAIAQYVEVVPTGAGGSAIGAEKPVSTPLPADKASSLLERGGDAAATLDAVATSSAYGAPTRRLPVVPSSASSERGLHPDRSPSPAVPSLGAIAMGGGSSTRLVGLAAVMVVTAGLAVGAALFGRNPG